MTPEIKIRNQICNWLWVFKIQLERDGKERFKFWVNSSVGIWDQRKQLYRKNRSPWNLLGVCDIIGCLDGRFIGIEVKTESGRVSTAQKIFIDHITEIGGLCFVARSVDDVKTAFSNQGLL